MLALPAPASAAAYEATVREHYLDLADDYLKLYPASHLEDAVVTATRDGMYGWTAERLVRKQAALGQPSFLYLFDHGFPAADGAGLHGFHGSELPFVFGTIDRTPPAWPKAPAAPSETRLSDAMVGYWSSFAATGAPTAAGAPAWPAYGATGAYMRFTDAPHPSTDALAGAYALHEAVVCRRRASGDQAWNWNVGLASPRLPPPTSACDGPKLRP
jgi:para-nitrobenzyl esterase